MRLRVARKIIDLHFYTWKRPSFDAACRIVHRWRDRESDRVHPAMANWERKSILKSSPMTAPEQAARTIRWKTDEFVRHSLFGSGLKPWFEIPEETHAAALSRRTGRQWLSRLFAHVSLSPAALARLAAACHWEVLPQGSTICSRDSHPISILEFKDKIKAVMAHWLAKQPRSRSSRSKYDGEWWALLASDLGVSLLSAEIMDVLAEEKQAA